MDQAICMKTITITGVSGSLHIGDLVTGSGYRRPARIVAIGGERRAAKGWRRHVRRQKAIASRRG
jgi:hypothetical protein